MSSLPPGNYTGTFVSLAVTGDNASVEIRYNVNGESVTVYLSTHTEASWGMTEEVLKRIGFNGNFEQPACNESCELYMAMESYNGKSKERWNVSRGRPTAPVSVLSNLTARFKASNPTAPKKFTPKATEDDGPPAAAAVVATKASAWAVWKERRGGDAGTWASTIAEIMDKHKILEKDFTPAHWSSVIVEADIPF